VHKSINESESLKLILQEFLNKNDVEERLKLIAGDTHKYPYYGWEKWIQFELFKFLTNYEHVSPGEIYLEDYFDNDMRKDKIKTKQYIDLTFRLRNKQYYIPVELKIKEHLSLSAVEKDLNKNKSIKPSQKHFFRQVFSVLFHKTMKEELVKIKSEKIDSIKHEFSIQSTSLTCSVFSSQIK
jgi:hypothetical protein